MQLSVLKSSQPGDGASLEKAPSEIAFDFTQPVRLKEVTVVGAKGDTVPSMVEAAGLLQHYSVPLPDLTPGAYRVDWTALDEGGRQHNGSIGFTIR